MAEDKFEVADWGIDHAQYFPGVPSLGWSGVALGAGSTAREAGRDALESLYQQVRPDQIDIQTLKAIEDKVEALDETEYLHDACREEFDRHYVVPTEWTVSRQHPWDGEPAEEYVEVSVGHEDMGAGMVGASYSTHDPDAVVVRALELSKSHGGLPIYFGGACFGASDDALSKEQLEEWASRQGQAAVDQAEQAFERWHESCEMSHYVSIRWR